MRHVWRATFGEAHPAKERLPPAWRISDFCGIGAFASPAHGVCHSGDFARPASGGLTNVPPDRPRAVPALAETSGPATARITGRARGHSCRARPAPETHMSHVTSVFWFYPRLAAMHGDCRARRRVGYLPGGTPRACPRPVEQCMRQVRGTAARLRARSGHEPATVDRRDAAPNGPQGRAPERRSDSMTSLFDDVGF